MSSITKSLRSNDINSNGTPDLLPTDNTFLKVVPLLKVGLKSEILSVNSLQNAKSTLKLKNNNLIINFTILRDF